MFYIYTIFSPLLIVGHVFLINCKTTYYVSVLNRLFKSILPLYLYAFILYFVDMENYIDTGWSFYSIMFFLIPCSIIV